MSSLYNVYVIDTDNFKATKCVAKEVTGREASDAESSFSGNIDFFAQSYEVGSERDLECVKDLKKLSKKK